ncbi:MAG: peptidase S10 [Pseudomonadota bacterium]|nr:peptidase S10 [Pseudomonadota bacterium]
MRHRQLFASLAAALMLAAAVPAIAQSAATGKSEAGDKAAAKPSREPKESITRHSGAFNGRSISYDAVAGEIFLKDADGKPKAAIYSTSYIKTPRDATRPVVFLFNGGPGSGSLWLHMGAFGPKRVVVPSDARDDGAPPYPIVHNPHALLDIADFVFIDPVGTGFSRALEGTDAKDYWGVTADAKSIASFIRLWLTQHNRWNSPKFLGGESYGTTRSIAVAQELEGSYNDVALNGILLISTILDFGLSAETPGNEMAYVVNLPSYAATAWYHGKIANRPAKVADFVDEARRFAIGPYLAALAQGNSLSDPERIRVRAELARLTGLSEAYLDRARLRVSPGRFYKELLRDRSLVVGRLDSRYTGRDADDAGEFAENDPSFYGIDAAYTAAMNAYARETLKYSPEIEYNVIGGVGPWDWRIGQQRGGTAYVSVAPFVGPLLRQNSGLRIFVAQGWYDHATPFFAAEYALNRTGIPQERIEWQYYDAGHMMYVNEPDLVKLNGDIRRFIENRTTGR